MDARRAEILLDQRVLIPAPVVVERLQHARADFGLEVGRLRHGLEVAADFVERLLGIGRRELGENLLRSLHAVHRVIGLAASQPSQHLLFSCARTIPPAVLQSGSIGNALPVTGMLPLAAPVDETASNRGRFRLMHAHAHAHDHAAHSSERRLFWALTLTFLYMLVQVAGGLLSGSLALLADSGHMLADAGALAFAWMWARLAHRQ